MPDMQGGIELRCKFSRYFLYKSKKTPLLWGVCNYSVEK